MGGTLGPNMIPASFASSKDYAIDCLKYASKESILVEWFIMVETVHRFYT